MSKGASTVAEGDGSANAVASIAAVTAAASVCVAAAAASSSTVSAVALAAADVDRHDGRRASRSSIPNISAAIVAIVLYLAVNGMASLYLPVLMQDLLAWQNHDACWWTVKNFKDTPGRADVLMLGSSLMCRVINEGDATYLNHPLNAMAHFRSEHLEDALSNLHSTMRSAGATSPDSGSVPHYRSISLAVGGMNASDVSTLVPPLLTAEKTPAAIVYGIGPRDLFDNSLESAADAPAFRLAEKLQTFDAETQKNARPSREAQFKLAINRILQFVLPLYRYQDELVVAFRRQSLAAIDILAPKPSACALPPLTTVQRAQLHLVASDAENECLVKPDDPLHPDHFDFNNNYFMSYNPFRPALYRRQLFFLNRFLKYSTSHGIKTFVVKMPLRADNLSLMVPNFYDLYNRDVDLIAQANGVTVIDASKAAQFSDSDFTDTVHLSGRGACKLIDAIAPVISDRLPSPIR